MESAPLGPAGGSRIRHHLGFALVYAAAMALARTLPLGELVLSFIWPACGVATLWLLFTPDLRSRLVDAGLIVVVTTLVNVVTEVPLGLSAWFGGVNLAQGLIGAALLCRLVPELWGCRGRQSFTTVGSVLHAVAAAVVSSAVAALLAAPGLMAAGATVSAESLLAHLSRNTYGFLAVVTVGHLLLHALRLGRDARLAGFLTRPSGGETAGLALLTAALYAVVYLTEPRPMAWLPLIPTLWAGLRFSPLVVGLQSTAGSAVAFWATITDHGPLALVDDQAQQAWLLQGVLSVTLLSGLVLAASRQQMVLLLRDVDSERRAADDAAGLMATTLGALHAGLVVVRRDGTVERANEPGRVLLADQLTQSHPMTASSWDDLWRAVIAQGGVVEVDVQSQDATGARRFVKVNAVPLEGDRGVVVHLADVTAQQETHLELVSFAAHAAHDLRGPLMAVRGWLDLMRTRLEGGPLEPAEGRLFLDRADGTAARMATLLNDLVDHAAGDDDVTSEDVDLAAIVRDAADQAGATDAVEVGALPVVRGDRTLLTRVVLNLVTNAVKYAADDRPLRLTVTSSPLLSGEVELRFADNGIGIPGDHLEAVFKPFHRATTRGTGNGMGLAMCRQILERHGGTITALAGLDVGTVIVVTLPLDAVAPTEVPGADARVLGLAGRLRPLGEDDAQVSV